MKDSIDDADNAEVTLQQVRSIEESPAVNAFVQEGCVTETKDA